MTYLEKINGEYPNIPSMETRIQELTEQLKEMDFDSLGYKIIWDERADLKRELAAIKHKENRCIQCGQPGHSFCNKD